MIRLPGPAAAGAAASRSLLHGGSEDTNDVELSVRCHFVCVCICDFCVFVCLCVCACVLVLREKEKAKSSEREKWQQGGKDKGMYTNLGGSAGGGRVGGGEGGR